MSAPVNARALRATAAKAVSLFLFLACWFSASAPFLGMERAQAQSGGRIAGRVTSAREPGGVKDVQVAVYDQKHTLLSSSLTAFNGTYVVGGLPAGKYKVRFEPARGSDYFPQWYKDRADIEVADWVTVTSGTTTSGINAYLWEGGRITGRVTSAREPGGVQDVYVCVYDQKMSLLGDGFTGANGTYTVRGLPFGNYRIRFLPREESGYLPQWYHNKPDDSAADVVSVTEGATTSRIDALLKEGGRITGRVTSAREPGGVEGIEVYAWSPEGDWFRGAQTGTDGTYEIAGLPAGGYKVEFRPPYGGDYAFQWYAGKSGSETADVVSVTEGATTSGIDALLKEGGRITGRVTSTAEPGGVQYTWVYACEPAKGIGMSIGFTGSDGTYEIRGLPAGLYKVVFLPPPGSNYLVQWYANKAGLATADVVTVTEGATASGVNALLKEGGRITGRVTSAKEPGGVADVGVWVYDLNGKEVGTGWTGPDGTYEVPALPSGRYKVCFRPSWWCNYLPQWYRRKASLATADVVTVTEGATASGVNALLKEGGRITGRVTSGKEPGGVAGAGVWLYDLEGNEVKAGWTGPDGSYEIPGLASGRYKVQFHPPGRDDYLPQWYRNKDSLQSADVVTVIEGATTAGIDAVLSRFKYNVTTTVNPAGSGTVSGAGAHLPWERVTLTATPAAGFRFVNWTMDGREVSTSPTLTLTVAGDRSLVANFEPSLPAPYISSLSPTTGSVGAVVTITGRNFGAYRGTSYVSFGDTAATDYLFWSDTQIKVRVPRVAAGLTRVTVTTAGGRSNYKIFYVISFR